MRTTISLPDPLLANSREYAAAHSITLSTLVEDALRRLLARDETSPPAAFKLFTVKGKPADTELDLDRTSLLLERLG